MNTIGQTEALQIRTHDLLPAKAGTMLRDYLKSMVSYAYSHECNVRGNFNGIDLSLQYKNEFSSDNTMKFVTRETGRGESSMFINVFWGGSRGEALEALVAEYTNKDKEFFDGKLGNIQSGDGVLSETILIETEKYKNKVEAIFDKYEELKKQLVNAKSDDDIIEFIKLYNKQFDKNLPSISEDICKILKSEGYSEYNGPLNPNGPDYKKNVIGRFISGVSVKGYPSIMAINIMVSKISNK